ncbi:AAA family ATPase [Stakelama sp. CBK3Z-3]|uniref:AAA family ATPase n=1 Tax=Stakelama flava TaxID=2860338 RepID=A0ABS6XL67_9SPHN|nr:AAA family ATPase [Stakelama flava]
MTQIIGNGRSQAAFFTAAASESMPHTWLITGPEGIGKASFARAAAAHVLAHAADPHIPLAADVDLSGNAIASQIASGSHPDFRVLERLPKDAKKPDGGLARSIKVDQVRELQPMFATRPTYSNRRIVIIDSIDDCERSAANALLKNLEEPPAGTIFLLISHSPGRLLPTIRSRCRVLRFDALDDGTVAAILRRHLPDADADEIETLVHAGKGSPGRAIAFAGLDLAAIEREVALIAKSGDPNNAIRSRLGSALGTKAAQPRYEAFLERAPSFIAECARDRQGHALRTALDAYRDARSLCDAALGLSLDPQATVFEMGGVIARLAD